LEEADLHPHRSRYWLNPKIDDPVAHNAAVTRICEVYQRAAELSAQGTHVVSCDEKTGIQALERAAPTRPMRLGRDELREFEYIRHGTLCLMANLMVATGKVIAPTVGLTRSEEDFFRHLQKTVATDPNAGWVFVVDNLNTHCSESLVRWIAELENVGVDLGHKGKHGILHNTASRSAFLSESAHRVRFVYTPKHCSWLNQIETWFSILSRRALKRASFVSTEELGKALLSFIDYFNRLLAKPFRWTYKGRPLTV
jgi:transposase